MGLGTNSNKIYLSIADGKIVQKAKADTPGAQPRTKKDGTIIHEMRYAYVSGILTNITTRTSQYAGTEIKEWAFDITDGNDNFQLQIMYDSRYATSLLKALANPEIDFSQPITITPWMKVVNDKKKTNTYVKQGEKSIDWFFTRDEPNGLPDLKEVTFKGKTTWDSYDQLQFLEAYVEKHIKPQLSNPMYVPVQKHPDEGFTPEYADEASFNQAPPDDDLPF